MGEGWLRLDSLARILTILGALAVFLSPAESAPLALKTAGHKTAYLFPLLQAQNMTMSPVVRRILNRRQLPEARMWLYGHVLTEGYYYTMLGLGTPAQQFALIVDTGSTVTYVPCKSCTHCGSQHQDNPYIPTSSSSYQEVPCDSETCPGRQCGPNQVCSYSRHYAEDSTSAGIIASDLASFGSTSSIAPTRILFGCETTETGDLYTQRADGIIGMGKGSLGIMNQLVAAKATEDQFSLCYGGMERGGGSMILGAIKPPPGMQFVPLASKTGEGTYYNVLVSGLKVAGEDLKLDPGMFNSGYGSVLDSGTTFTYLPTPAFKALKEAVTKAVMAKGLSQVAGPDPHYDDVCFGPATDDPSKLAQFFPPVTLMFHGDIGYQLSPENMLFRHTGDQNAYCLGVFENKDRGTLLGGILVRNTMVMYDRAGGRVGFWKTNCSDLFEILTKMEGVDAPPLPPELADAPPADVKPTTAGMPEITPPPSVPSSSWCEGCAAELKISFKVAAPESSFSADQDLFVQDVARELSIDIVQVTQVTFESSPTAGVGEGTVVHVVVIPPAEGTVLSADTVKRIQSTLQSAAFSFRDAFGSVSMESFEVVPPQAPHATAFYWYIIAALLSAGVVIAAVLLIRRRMRPQKFDAMEEQRREEKAALAESAADGESFVDSAAGDIEGQETQSNSERSESGRQGSERERLSVDSTPHL